MGRYNFNLILLLLASILEVHGENKTIPKISDNYFIFTSGCQIRTWPIHSPEVESVFKSYNVNCILSDKVVESYYDRKKERYFLRHVRSGYSCEYCPVIRKADRQNKPLICYDFTNNFEVPLHVDHAIVKCQKQSKFVNDGFAFIQKRKFGRTKKLPSNKMPSILILGIDSMSRINLRRLMPETFKYVSDQEKGFVELKGYNKVEDNTLPNLMAVLTGQNWHETLKNCNMQNLNNCRFIWSSFEKLGYITAYAEDGQRITTFNYNGRGFTDQPFDFYFKPLGIEMEKHMPWSLLAKEVVCIGHKFYADYIYQYGLDFATNYNDTPTFGLFWSNTFSHGTYDSASIYDQNLRNFFEKFERNGIFEDSIVFFISDHGFRHGDITRIQGGFMETRLPFFFVRLPEWFKRQYPKFQEALQVNGKRLVSNYDIHQTFKHIIRLYQPSARLDPTVNCKRCQSIFMKMPESRTCQDAGIMQTYCTCNEFFPVRSFDEKIYAMTHATIRAMNEFLFTTNANMTGGCSELSLNEILSAKKRFERIRAIRYTFALVFSVSPFNATFEAVVEFNARKKKVYGAVEEINRLDSYDKTAGCMNEKVLKKYCLCKDSKM